MERIKKTNISSIFRNASLKQRTLFAMAVLLLTFALLFLLLYTSMVKSLTAEREESAVELTLDNAFSNIHLLMDSYSDMSRLIMLNSEVTDYLSARRATSHLDTRARVGIYSITNIYSYVDSVYLFRLDGEHVNTSQGITLLNARLMQSRSWRAPLLEAKGASVISVNGDGATYKDSGKPIITLARMIYDVNTQRVKGVMLVNIDVDALREPLQSATGARGRICAFSNDGQILYGDEELAEYFDARSAQNAGYHTVRQDDEGRTIAARRGEDMPITILYVNDVSAHGVFPKQSIVLFLVLVLAFVLSVLLSGVFVTINITRPIGRLTQAIDETKSSGYLQPIALDLPSKEIEQLKESYNSMIAHLNDLIEKLLENEKSVQRAEMRILHEQIKPHFLYNSLETISYMALQAQAPRVYDALETLGSFYRNFLSKGDREIPLKREVKITQDYLALQHLRYGDMFVDEYDVDPALNEYRIPKLILQPLVENSLYHGIQLKGEKGLVRVSARRAEEGGIRITVYDTGVGMSEAQIKDALSDTPPELDALSGFGLKGTIERIRYYCNSRDAVQIRSEIGEFTEIEIIVPVKSRGRSDADV